MSDLQNRFPDWGESGTLPSSGFFYDGGDQVNEKHLDALWNNIDLQFDELITGIRDRVRDLDGDRILDSGMSVSTTTNTREVSISSSSAGAYVDGQKTGSTSSTTITLSANGGTSTRTDSIWVDTTGQVGATEGTTTVNNDQHKLAEVDVASNDTISAVRNTGNDLTSHVASENAPSSPSPGDEWYDHSVDKLKGRINGAWRPLLPADGSQPLVGSLDVNGNDVRNLNRMYASAQFAALETYGTGDGSWEVYDSANSAPIFYANEGGLVEIPNGPLEVGSDIQTTGTTTIWDSTNGYVPATSVQDVWVDASGDTIKGHLESIERGASTGPVTNEGSRAFTMGGSAGPLTASIQGGLGRSAFTWNAQFDGTNNYWRAVNGSEGVTLVGLGSTSPHGNLGDSFTVAIGGSADQTADSQVVWGGKLQFDENGDHFINGTYNENASL